MQQFSVPEGRLATILLNGAEIPFVSGREYPDEAELVLTEPMAEIPAFLAPRGLEPYRAAVMVTASGIDEKNSVRGAIQCGTVTEAGMDGVAIDSSSDDFSAVISVGGSFSIKNSVLNFKTKSDGKHVCDFSGYGAILAGFQGARFNVEHTQINSEGVAKPALFADNRSECLFRDCNVTVRGGRLYEGYRNSADMKTMVAPPWVLGITGNARGVNLMGDRGTAYVVDSCFKANQWGVISTDAGNKLHLYVVDSDLILLGENLSLSDVRDPYATKYGSGYGTYIIGEGYEEFLGAEIKVGGHGAVLRSGEAVYKSSRGHIRLISPVTGETVYEGEGKGRITRIQAEFGVMAHGDGKITYTDGTQVETGNAVFLLKSGGVTCNVEDGAVLQSGNGVILQMIDDDDNLVGAQITAAGPMFNTEFHEAAGWPSENGQITSIMPKPEPKKEGPGGPGGPMPGGPSSEPVDPDCFLNTRDVLLNGNIFNGTGYYGEPAKPLHVTFGRNTIFSGAVSATETRHVDENGNQNTSFTIREYYYLAHVENRNYYNGDNTVTVTICSGAVWNVTAPGIITGLIIEDGGTLNGTVTENEDGTLTVAPL